jgi:hypothetical protein
MPLYLIVAASLAGLLGALGRRVAGGAFQQWSGVDVGDTPARVFFGWTMAVAAWLADPLVWWHPLVLIPLVWIGTTVPNFSSIGMGVAPPRTYWQDFWGLSLHGLLGIAPAALALWWSGYGWCWMVGAGCLIAPLYTIGWRISGLRGKLSFPVGLQGGTELGEAFWGCATGVAVFLAIS